MTKWLKLLIPMFVVDTLVCYGDECGIEPICSLEFLPPEQDYDCVVRVKVFTWFGFSFPTCMGQMYTIEEYESEHGKIGA